MGNYIIFGGSENARRGRQARNFTTNVPKILDLKSSSEQIFSENWCWVPACITVWEQKQKGQRTVCTFVGGEQYPSDLFLTSLGFGYMCNPPGTEAERGNKVCSFWWVKKYSSDLFLSPVIEVIRPSTQRLYATPKKRCPAYWARTENSPYFWFG